MTYRVGIDIGGTFTDFALLKGDEVVLHKNLSTPQDRSLGVMEGLGKLAAKEGLPLGEFLSRCEAIVHGTTVADNTLIEMNGALTGLITTEGFRDEIEYRRGYKEDIWDVRLEAPQQITPRRRRLTVPERVLHDGAVHKPLDEAALREACRKLRLQNVESVAISFLFSFANPEHERRAKEIVQQEIQNAHVSVSHEVLPRAPEYDRTSTTVVNAYVAPRVNGYLEKLVQRLGEGGYPGQLMVMQALSLIHISEPTRPGTTSKVPRSACWPPARPAGSSVPPMRAAPRAARTCSASTWAAPATTWRWC